MTLRTRLAERRIVLAPGIYDALSATLAERAGAEALYLSGASIAYTRLGRPDIGLVSMSEVAETVALICDRVRIPVIVDADTGYGNALNVERTVRAFERAGAAAIQLEDQVLPKRCGHLGEKRLVSTDEMVSKIAAALASRRSAHTLIIARTDAVGVEGFDAAVERAGRYAEAGADVLFVEAPGNAAELTDIPRRLGRRLPLMANMVEGGLTPTTAAHDLEAMGFSLVIFPGGAVRAIARTLEDFYATLVGTGTSASFRNRMHDFTSLNQLLETARILERGKRYESGTTSEGTGE